MEAVAPAKVAEEQAAKRGQRAVAGKAAHGSAEGAGDAKKAVVKKPSTGKGKAGKASADSKKVEKEAGKKANGGKRGAGEAVKEWSVQHITAQSDWPITTVIVLISLMVLIVLISLILFLILLILFTGGLHADADLPSHTGGVH